ncbi:hypothetical protein TgHK011_010104 [Trichoderma gracile]|nr:hypothetical protein TgHK011_010104 [Trichoderma gracile]
MLGRMRRDWEGSGQVPFQGLRSLRVFRGSFKAPSNSSVFHVRLSPHQPPLPGSGFSASSTGCVSERSRGPWRLARGGGAPFHAGHAADGAAQPANWTCVTGKGSRTSGEMHPITQ